MASWTQALGYTQIQGGNKVSLPTTISSIPTFKNPTIASKIQQKIWIFTCHTSSSTPTHNFTT